MATVARHRLDEASILHTVLATLAQRTGAHVPEQAADLRFDGRHVWQEDLARGCEALGLAATGRKLSPREVWRQARADAPQVIFAPSDDGGPRWLIVGERRGKRLHLLELAPESVNGGRVSVAELASLLGVGEKDPQSWVVVDPAMPLECLKERSQGAGSPTRQALARLWRLMRLEGHAVAIVALYALIAGLFALATPLTAQALVNTIAFGSLVQPLVVITVLLLGMLVAVGGLRLIQTWVVELVQRRLFVRVVADLSARLPRVATSARDRSYQPELVNRFFDVVTVQKAASGLLLDGLELMLTAGIGLLVLAFYHPLLLAFDVVLLLALVAITVGLGGGTVSTALKESKAKYRVAAWLEELARHPTTFGSQRGGRVAAAHADTLARSYLAARGDHFRLYLRQLGGAFVLQAIASASLLGLGGYLVLNGQLTLGQLVAAELIVTAVVASLAKFGKHLETFYDLSAAVDKLGQLVDLPLEEVDGQRPPGRQGPLGVALRGVSLTHPGGGTAVEDLDLMVAPGEHVALRGSASTLLLDSLWGLRAPAAGSILVEGRELGQLHRGAWRDEVSLLRSPEIVEGSIEDNLRLERPTARAESLELAIAATGLAPAVERLGGIDASLASGGAPLTHEEQVAMVVARSLVARPRLLLVDGLLDTVSAQLRGRLLQAILAPNAPWTAVVATANEAVAKGCPKTLDLESPCKGGGTP